jgi:ketosteroid isomerase-like protein
MPGCEPGDIRIETDTDTEPEVDYEAEEKAIREVISRIREAYGKKDAKVMADTADEKLYTFTETAEGSEAIERMFADFFEDNETMKLNPLEDMGVHFLTPNVAVFMGRYEFLDMVDAEGKPLPPQEFIGVNHYVKRNGQWKRASAYLRYLN